MKILFSALVLVVALYLPAWGAVTHDANSACSATADTDLTPDFGPCSHTVGSLTNGILIFLAGIDHGTNQFTACRWNGDSMTRYVRNQRTGSVAPEIEIWYIVNPDSGTNNLECDFSSSTATGVAGHIVSYSGVHQVTPFTDDQQNEGDAQTSSSVTVTCPTGNLAVDLISSDTSANFTVSGSNTELREVDGTNNSSSVSTLAGAGSTALSWTFTSENINHQGVCLMEATTPPATDTPRAPIILY